MEFHNQQISIPEAIDMLQAANQIAEDNLVRLRLETEKCELAIARRNRQITKLRRADESRLFPSSALDVLERWAEAEGH